MKTQDSYLDYAILLNKMAKKNKIFLEEIQLIIKIFTKNKKNLDNKLKLHYLLSHMKKISFERVFSNFSQITKDFLKILFMRKKLFYLKEIYEEFLLIYKRENKIKDMFLTTANDICDKEKNELKTYFEKKFNCNLLLHYKIDKRLISGIKICIDDKCFDGSIKNKLNKLLKGGINVIN